MRALLIPKKYNKRLRLRLGQAACTRPEPAEKWDQNQSSGARARRDYLFGSGETRPWSFRVAKWTWMVKDEATPTVAAVV